MLLPAQRARQLIPFAAIFLLCSIIYSNTLHNKFVLDDYNYLVHESTGISSIKSIRQIFTEQFQGVYRPFVVLFLWILYGLFKTDPTGYHAINILLFSGMAWLFWLIYRQLFDDRAALLTAALFAAHPIHAGLVNYTVGSIEIIFVIVMQINCLLFLKYLKTSEKKFYYLSLLLYLISLLSHEMAVIVPVALFLLARYTTRMPVRDSLILLLPYSPVLAFYIYLRGQIVTALADVFAFWNLSVVNYLIGLAQLVAWYIAKLIIPVNILISLDIPVPTQNRLIQALFLVLLTSVSVYFIKIFRGKKVLGFNAMLFGAGFLPLMMAGTIYAETFKILIIEPHWFTFASIGFFGLIVGVILNTRIPSRAQNLFLAVLILSLASMTYVNNRNWRDEKALSEYWLSINPADHQALTAKYRVYIQEHFRGFDRSVYSDEEKIRHLMRAFYFFGDTSKVERLQALLTKEAGTGLIAQP